MFDTKAYERAAFEERLPDALRVRWIDARLGRHSARLAEGYPVVCAFVNDDLSRPVIEELAARGVRLLALRCAGYNNVDLAAATAAGIQVVRVPAYSPHAVAEHTIALLLTLVRTTHRAFVRVREGNFSLAGLVGISDVAGYCASKGGVTTLSKSVALYCAEQRLPIRCVSVHPTYVDSEMLDPIADAIGNRVRQRAPSPAGCCGPSSARSTS